MPAPVSRRPPRTVSRRWRRVNGRVLGVVVLATALILGGLWAYYHRPNVNNWTPDPQAGIRIPARYAVHGIDVSKFQGPINWEKVRAVRLTDQALPLRFAFIKATEGQGLADKAFIRNWAGAKRAGLRRGAYHFYLPFRDPVRQASHFVKTVRLEKGDLAPVLDVELNALRPDGEIIRDLETWLSLVEAHYGVRPIIYTNPFFYRKFIRGHFDEYPLWIADYSNERLEGYPSGRVYFWQHSKAGWCRGVAGPVDFNAFLFDDEKLADICVP